MPSWTIHCYIANKISESLNIDKNTFLFANIMPDIDSGNYYTHYYGTYICENCKDEDLPDIDRFLNVYKDKLSNPLILGYYCHLLTDFCFNNYAYSNKWLIENGKTVGVYNADGRKTYLGYHHRQEAKRKDFIRFDKDLDENYNIVYPVYNENIISNLKLLNPKFISADEIKPMLNKMNYYLEKGKGITYDYSIFTNKELMDLTNNTIEFIKEKLYDLELNKKIRK